jgi:hypothetical protein
MTSVEQQQPRFGRATAPMVTRTARRLVLCVAVPYASGSVFAADDLQLLGGAVHAQGSHRNSSNYQLSYEASLDRRERFAAGLTYLNEGHFSAHHRDGFAALLWGRWRPGDGRLRLSAGLGPYYYFDTAASGGRGGFHDAHGIGMLYSLAAAYDVWQRLFVEARANRTDSQGLHPSRRP